MTLAEAIEKAREETLVTRATIGHHVAGQSPVNLQDVVVALEALGLIKFHEPKTVENEACAVLIGVIGASHAGMAVDRLNAAGFKIVRA